MVTNEERREVAKKLRKLAGTYVTLGDLQEAFGIDLTSPDVDIERDEKNLNRLADLIEPEPERTCKFIHHECRHPNEKDPCGKYQDCEWSCAKDSFYCSSCDKRVAVSFAEQLKVKKYSFCPYCDAKVVES